MKHSSVVGGSTCARLIACPGSADLIKTVPVPPGSDYAAEGSMLHDVTERVLMNVQQVAAADLLGFESHGHKFNEEQLHTAVIPNLENFDKVAAEFGIDFYDCEVKADWSSVIPGAFGSIDVLGRGDHYNLVYDHKFGRGVPVGAVDNKQLLFYAVGAMLNPKLKDLFNTDNPTVLAIGQPRIPDGNSHWVVDTKHLEAFKHMVIAAVARSKGSTTYVSGSHCKFCPAKPVCPNKTGKAEGVTVAFDTDRLAELLPLANEMEDWAKSVRAAAHLTLESGKPIAGYKLVQKKGTRQWRDKDAIVSLLRKKRVPLKTIFERKLKSPAQLTKCVELDLEKEIVTRSSGTTIALSDDKRPAVLPFGAAKRNLQRTLL